MLRLIQLTYGPLSITLTAGHVMRMDVARDAYHTAQETELTAAVKRERLRGDTTCTATLPLPALSPKIVTRAGSPPNAAMFS